MKTTSVQPVPCAIYTRVSTDQGLDQEFNSLDAQYDASSAYIKSQVHASWMLIKMRYDDGGYSGGSSMRRLAEDGRSEKEIAAVSGHKSLREVRDIQRPPINAGWRKLL
jgi:site-specific DNA recombinase